MVSVTKIRYRLLLVLKSICVECNVEVSNLLESRVKLRLSKLFHTRC